MQFQIHFSSSNFPWRAFWRKNQITMKWMKSTGTKYWSVCTNNGYINIIHTILKRVYLYHYFKCILLVYLLLCLSTRMLQCHKTERLLWCKNILLVLKFFLRILERQHQYFIVHFRGQHGFHNKRFLSIDVSVVIVFSGALAYCNERGGKVVKSANPRWKYCWM